VWVRVGHPKKGDLPQIHTQIPSHPVDEIPVVICHLGNQSHLRKPGKEERSMHCRETRPPLGDALSQPFRFPATTFCKTRRHEGGCRGGRLLLSPWHDKFKLRPVNIRVHITWLSKSIKVNSSINSLGLWCLLFFFSSFSFLLRFCGGE
jgi:hypothetical protein